ncbi:MAG: hypothetical protein R3A46_00610 [Thermomicrobiales bacterium]
MATRQICSIVDVQERDDFDELIHDLGRHTATTITIDVAAEVDVLTMPFEFELLVDSAAANDVEVEISTEDPVRQELARIYGLGLASGSAGNPTAMFREMETVSTPVFPTDASLPDEIPPTQQFLQVTVPDRDRRSTGDLDQISPFDSDASFSFVVAPPRESFGPAPARSRKRAARKAAKPANVSRSLGWGSVVVSAMAVAAAVATLLIALLAPSANVVIVPETRTLDAEVTYGLEGSAVPLDIAVVPTTLKDTITFEATVPATGESLVPDGTARGMVYVTNPSSEEIVLPTGTIFTGPNGEASYLSVEEIDIPAADPFGSARFGTAVVEVEATEPGPSGNLDVGELSGTLASGILYQNRFPIEGGTSKAVAVVTESDIESVKSAARDGIETLRPSSLDEQIPGGWAVAQPATIKGDILMTVSTSTGTVANEVSVVATADIEGTVYDPAALEADARDQIQRILAAAVPEGFGLDMESLRTSVPRAVGDGSSVAFILTAEATAAAQFDAVFRDELAGDLVGKGEEHAVETLESLQHVNAFSVSYGPDWLPWNPVPRFEERISIDVDGS